MRDTKRDDFLLGPPSSDFAHVLQSPHILAVLDW